MPTPVPVPWLPALPDGVSIEERGAFAIARCDWCGWRGAARRSRERARADLDRHVAHEHPAGQPPAS